MAYTKLPKDAKTYSSEPDVDDAPTKSKKAMLKEARARFKLASEAEADRRKQQREDLRFQIGELQWSEEAKSERRGGQLVGGIALPARPMLSINKLDQPIQQIENQMREARLGINIQPLSPDSDDDDAEVIQGIVRGVERESQANNVRAWGFARAIRCGMGWYRINTCFDPTTDDPNDQMIRYERILYQENVYVDPAAWKSDFSDARFLFYVTWVPLSEFKEQFPKAKSPDSDPEMFSPDGDEPTWIRDEGENGKAAVLVAEYWYKKWEEDDPDHKKLPKVYVCKVTAAESLDEPQEWNGHYFPFIPVLGRELQPVDGKRHFYGIIRPNMDAQRTFNYSITTVVELVALEPKAPWIMADGQQEGFVSQWQQSNTRNFPYLLYKPTTADGKPFPPPARVQIDTGRLGPAMQMAQMSDQALQSGTMIHDPGLGKNSPREKSGVAIQSLQQQGDMATSDFLGNLANISMPYDARVVLDLIPTVYDRPERIARILGVEDDSRLVMLNAPYYVDPNSKRPQAIPVQMDGDDRPVRPLAPVPGQDPRMPQPGPAQPAGVPPGPEQLPKIRYHDLKNGIYTVSVSIGRSKQSELEAGNEAIGQVIQAHPEMWTLLAPTWLKYQSWPGHQEMADLMTKVRDKQFPGLNMNEEDGPTPEQLTSENQGLKQQLEQMGQQMQAMGKALETDQAKQQATIQKAQMDGQTRVQVESIRSQSEETQEAMRAQSQEQIAGLKSQMDLIVQMLKHGHEEKRAAKDAAHEVAMAGEQTRHDLATQTMASVPPVQPPTLELPEPSAASVGMPLSVDPGEV